MSENIQLSTLQYLIEPSVTYLMFLQGISKVIFYTWLITDIIQSYSNNL